MVSHLSCPQTPFGYTYSHLFTYQTCIFIYYTNTIWLHTEPHVMASHSYCSHKPFGYPYSHLLLYHTCIFHKHHLATHTATCYFNTLVYSTNTIWLHIQPPVMASHSYCSHKPFGYQYSHLLLYHTCIFHKHHLATHTATCYYITLILFSHTI